MRSVPGKSLSLFDSTCIIVGIIIGAGIYETSPMVAACLGGWGGTFAIWLAGGLLALCGALCYAELASTYPSQGGDVVYLAHAYGSWAGFLFGWSQMIVIRPADIALMAYVFARYAASLYAPIPDPIPVYAAGAVMALTAISILGVHESKWVQNILTSAKVAGIAFIIVAGLLSSGGEIPSFRSEVSFEGLKLGMILVLYTYGGWNEVAYVAAEIRNPRKNIVRALVLGTVAVTVLYLLINGAFFKALGYGGIIESDAVAVDAVATVLPNMAGRVVAVIICISALGAVNGLIFTGARISYALGAGHKIFRQLGKWHPRLGTPVAALVLQGFLSLGIILMAGSFIDTILYSAPAVWLFFLGSGVSLFVLRKREPCRDRPFKVTGYPVVPIVFCATCAFMLYGSASYAFSERPIGLLVLFAVLMMGGMLHARGK